MFIFIHMGTLYLAADLRMLADRLAANLDGEAEAGDFFAPARIVVPNRFIRKWLKLFLARQQSIAINLHFEQLEEALWRMLGECDSAPNPAEAIDDNVYRLMVLSVLLEERDPDLAPLRRYLRVGEGRPPRLSCRRAWYLADRLGTLIREYEYHRQDELIGPWLQGRIGAGNTREYFQTMERAQRAVFHHLTREPDGRRALLNRLGERTFKTFPQYAMERMTLGRAKTAKGVKESVHFFGFTHLSD